MMKYRPIYSGQSNGLHSRYNWRPWPLRKSFFAAFVTLCVFTCFAIELVLRRCSLVNCPLMDCSLMECPPKDCTKRGCHVFGELSETAISTTTYFAYNLLPTIISLGISLFWALPNHDIMRLEPYFQMSVPGGAAAADSLLLEYPYTPSLLILWQALKRKHYVVLLSSSIMLLMSFAITPLIAGIFDQETLTRSIQGTGMRAKIYPRPVDGESTLSARFTHLLYNYAWLNGSLPAFTTPFYALLPVQDGSGVVGNETWIANTTLFEAEAACESGVMAPAMYSNTTGLHLNITSQDGELKARFCDQAFQSGLFLPQKDDCDALTTFLTPWSSLFLNLGGTELRPQAAVLNGWATGGDPPWNSQGASPPPRNLTTLICTALYYTQDVTATFKIPSYEVISVSPTGDRQPFTNYTVDDIITGYFGALTIPDEYIDINGSIIGIGYLPPQLPNVDSPLQRRLGKAPASIPDYIYPRDSSVYMSDMYSLSSLMLYNQTVDSLDSLLDPEILKKTYNNALKLLFAFAVTTEFVNINMTKEISVVRQVLTQGFTMNHLWARGVQGLLVLVILMSTLLAILIERRRCELDGEPNSLAEVLHLLFASPGLAAEMENAEFYPPEALVTSLDKTGRFYMLQSQQSQGSRVKMLDTKEGLLEKTGLPGSTSKGLKPWTEQLWEAETFYGLRLIVYLGAVAVLLAASFLYSREYHGLPVLGGTGFWGYKVLYSFTPVAIGISIEPIIVAVGSYYCMLSPYNALTSSYKHNHRLKPLLADYDKYPPHFQLLRALRTGNTSLAALTIAILLANVLTVALAGIFAPKDGIFETQTDIKTPCAVHIREGFTVPAQEMYYQLSENLSSGVALPAWTNNEYYIPPSSPVDHPSDLQGYQQRTFGIGVDINCTLVIRDRVTLESSIVASWEDKIIPHFVLGIDGECSPDTYEWEEAGMNKWSTITSDHFVPSTNCSDTFFAIWLQLPGNMSQTDDIDLVVLECESAEKVVELIATNNKEQITSVSVIYKLGVEEISALYPPSTEVAARLAPTFIQAIYNGTLLESNPDNHRIRWFDHIMAVVEPSIARNPTKPSAIPDTAHLAKTFEDVYRRLFAINLRLYADDIFSITYSSALPTNVTFQRERVYLVTIMLYISVFVLLYTIMVLGLLYFNRGQQVLGHLPKSLAGVYTHLYASNVLEDREEIIGENPGERSRELERLGGSYSYGWFSNGRHYGVYRQEDEAASQSGPGSLDEKVIGEAEESYAIGDKAYFN